MVRELKEFVCDRCKEKVKSTSQLAEYFINSPCRKIDLCPKCNESFKYFMSLNKRQDELKDDETIDLDEIVDLGPDGEETPASPLETLDNPIYKLTNDRIVYLEEGLDELKRAISKLKNDIEYRLQVLVQSHNNAFDKIQELSSKYNDHLRREHKE